MQVVLNLAGLTLIPLVTAPVVDGMVDARLAMHAGGSNPAARGISWWSGWATSAPG